jgi:hypothetical protein
MTLLTALGYLGTPLWTHGAVPDSQAYNVEPRIYIPRQRKTFDTQQSENPRTVAQAIRGNGKH